MGRENRHLTNLSWIVDVTWHNPNFTFIWFDYSWTIRSNQFRFWLFVQSCFDLFSSHKFKQNLIQRPFFELNFIYLSHYITTIFLIFLFDFFPFLFSWHFISSFFFSSLLSIFIYSFFIIFHLFIRYDLQLDLSMNIFFNS